MTPLSDEFTTEDDFVVVRVAIHTKGQVRVRSYGPYTRAHADRVRRGYKQDPPPPGWTYHFSVTRMGREDNRLEVA